MVPIIRFSGEIMIQKMMQQTFNLKFLWHVKCPGENPDTATFLFGPPKVDSADFLFTIGQYLGWRGRQMLKQHDCVVFVHNIDKSSL